MLVTIVLFIDLYTEITEQCLDFIRKNADVPYEFIVVANCSNTDASEYFHRQDDLTFVQSDNVGISKAYNLGLENASNDIVLLMTQYSLLTPTCLSSMLRCLQSEEMTSIVGPVSNDVSGNQYIKIPYYDLSKVEEFSQSNRSQNPGQSKRVFRLLSHCMLVRKNLLKEIGGFDERFGLGTYEDDDLCLRLTNRGYSLYIALDAFVYYVNPLSLPRFDRMSFYKLLAENKKKAYQKWGFDVTEHLLKHKLSISISLCLIVKNEKQVLARCLDSVKDAVDEIIIVDTGSDDDTKKIASRYTELIYDFPWIDDFAAARNFAFDHANKDYIFWLDADDVLEEEDQQKMLVLKQSFDPTIDSVTMNYNLACDQYGNLTVSLRRNRLVKRTRNFRWIGAVHEYLAVYGNIVDSDIAVTHKSERHESDRNLRIYEKRLEAGENFSPRDQYYYANELLDHQMIEKAIEWYKKFLEGGQGWVEDNLATCKKLADCFHNLGDLDNAVKYIFLSFLYDTPRAEFCCRLGYHFIVINKYEQAAFWYNLATQLIKPINNRGFMENVAWTWLPHIQLCVCYDHLGDHERAYRHNETAAQFIPNDPKVLSNRQYLKKRLGWD